MTDVAQMHCVHCQRVNDFEQPECLDTHGADCPEWVCVLCGTAVFAGVTPPSSGEVTSPESSSRRTA